MPPGTLALSTPDTIVLVLVGFFALRGWFQGLVRQLLRTAGLAAGFLLGARWNVPAGRFLADHLSFVPRSGADVAGWVAIVLAVVLLVGLAAHVLHRAVEDAHLGGLDRLLGAALGGLLGLGIAALCFTLWASARTKEDVRAALADSASVAFMARFVSSVKPMFPEAVRERWAPVLESLPR